VCRAPGGTPRKIYPQNSTPKVTQIRAAGSFVGFFLITNAEVYSKYLVVFNRSRGTIKFKDLAECSGNDECTGPEMTSYRLARNGWAAELWPYVFSSAAGLLATDGGTHYQLDITRIRHLTLAGGRLSWTSTDFGGASVRLGHDLATPPTAGSQTACQLLRSADLTPVLGSGFTGSSGSGSGTSSLCQYTSAAYSGRTLTVTLTTGLSHAQVVAAESAGDYCAPGFWWPANDDFYDQASCTASGRNFAYQSFAHGAEIELKMNGAAADGDEQEAHLATVAFDRLFGVPVSRRS
jgi:hypothetical protein